MKLKLTYLLLLAVLMTGAARPQKLLFIGNSLTYRQNGIYSHLEKLTASAPTPFAIQTEKSVQGGATLKTLWDKTEPKEFINKGAFDVVVLQEDLPEINISYFREYARRFINEARKAKSEPILLMAWSYPRLGWISTDEIAKAHRDLAKEMGVKVAPVGLAWLRSLKERPDLELYAADKEHPTLLGTYLATCVVYATVFSESPVGCSYGPSGADPATTAFLQRVAWETCKEWGK